MASKLDRAMQRTPGYDRLESAGAMGGLLIKATRTAYKPPYSWVGDCLDEIAVTIRRCVVPLTLSAAFFSLGLATVFFGGIVRSIGTLDRLGGALQAGAIREPMVWVSMMIVAGVAGSAITADLAARKIRDELDAIAVLGVDSMRSLVVPRIVGLMIAMPLLAMYGLAVFIASAYFATTTVFSNGLQGAAFREALGAFSFAPDVVLFFVKLTIVGLFVGVVACYKGLTSGGGSEGVGRAVNECVLITFFGSWLFVTLLNGIFFSLFPDVLVLRG